MKASYWQSGRRAECHDARHLPLRESDSGKQGRTTQEVNAGMNDALFRAWCHGQTRYFEITRGERGATAVEYAIMVALIAAIIFAVVTVVGSKTSNSFESVNNAPW
jgi:pilus assembly protein Flp/PilA